MAWSEFDLIARFCADLGSPRADVALGVGDDCALLRVPTGMELAVSIDTLVEGVHFLPGTDPQGLGHKALAVGLSDLAAMGAEPAWATLALTLPQADAAWLEAFCRGFAALAERHGLRLVGGDTTRGPRSVSVQVHGLVAAGTALRRDGARSGDLIFVTGTLGDAGLALAGAPDADLAQRRFVQQRLDRPTPRVAQGRQLRGLARAAIDVSDGLVADLGHVLEASGVGATVQLERLPLSDPVRAQVTRSGDWSLPLAAGDDYELCFVAAPAQRAALEAAARAWDCRCTCIGTVETALGLRLLDRHGAATRSAAGFDHFAVSG